MIANESVPQPRMPAAPTAPVLTNRRRWYRRPLRVIPLIVLSLVLVTAGILAYRTLAAFDTVQSLSTPPPELSGAALGGDDGLVIDTGPAQEAVRQQQERERQQADPGIGVPGNDVALIATEEATTDAERAAHTSTNQPGFTPSPR